MGRTTSQQLRRFNEFIFMIIFNVQHIKNSGLTLALTVHLKICTSTIKIVLLNRKRERLKIEKR